MATVISVSNLFQLNFNFDMVARANDVMPVLVSNMRLHGLQIYSGYEDDVEWGARDIIQFVTKHYKSTIGKNKIMTKMFNMHQIASPYRKRPYRSQCLMQDFGKRVRF